MNTMFKRGGLAACASAKSRSTGIERFYNSYCQRLIERSHYLSCSNAASLPVVCFRCFEPVGTATEEQLAQLALQVIPMVENPDPCRLAAPQALPCSFDTAVAGQDQCTDVAQCQAGRVAVVPVEAGGGAAE